MPTLGELVRKNQQSLPSPKPIGPAPSKTPLKPIEPIGQQSKQQQNTPLPNEVRPKPTSARQQQQPIVHLNADERSLATYLSMRLGVGPERLYQALADYRERFDKQIANSPSRQRLAEADKWQIANGKTVAQAQVSADEVQGIENTKAAERQPLAQTAQAVDQPSKTQTPKLPVPPAPMKTPAKAAPTQQQAATKPKSEPPISVRQSLIAVSSHFNWSAESMPSDKHPDQNEDAWFVHGASSSIGVFDGLGAADRAHLASTRAAKEVEEALVHLRAEGGRDVPGALRRILTETHQLLGRQNLATGGNFATTAAIGIIEKVGEHRFLSFATVGDSRISVLRKTGQYELTALDDHLLRTLLLPANRRPTWVGQILKEQGLDANLVLPPQEIAKLGACLDQEADPATVSPIGKALFTERAIVTQTLGTGTMTPHSGRIDVQAGDRVLFATDGIHDNLTEKEIVTILRNTTLPDVASALVLRAHEVSQADTPRSKADDMTAIVLEIR